jgi:VanZ family protein
MRRPVVAILGLLFVVLAVLGFAPVRLPVNDKALHSVAFGTLAYVLYFLWEKDYLSNIGLTSASMVVLAVGSEFAQKLAPNRSFSYYDITFNLLGSVIGVVVALSSDYAWAWWTERERRKWSLANGVEYTELDEEDLELV